MKTLRLVHDFQCETHDFSTLACERWLNSFTLDVCVQILSKFFEGVKILGACQTSPQFEVFFPLVERKNRQRKKEKKAKKNSFIQKKTGIVIFPLCIKGNHWIGVEINFDYV